MNVSQRHFDAAVKLARRFPGIEVATSYGTPAIRVKGRFMARLRTEAEGWLAIKCDFIDREILLQAAPHVFHLTPHYENAPMILVDLAVIDEGALLEVIERAWRMTASPKAVREWDAKHEAAVPEKPPSAVGARRPIKTLDLRTRAQWHAWLEKHHASVAEVWLVFHKQHTGKAGIDYEAAVEEALCFGWIDSLVRRLDDERFARKFTPRKADSRWSDLNRRRYASLEKRGLLTDAGRANAPGGKRAYALRQRRPLDAPLPPYIERAFKADAAAWRFFQSLAPSYRRAYVGWIDAAKRAETRERRLREALERLGKGEKLGLK